MRVTVEKRYLVSTMYPDARIEETCEIGDNTKIWSGVFVGRGAKIGERCTIGQGVHIGPNVVIGNGCKIQNGVQLFAGVTLEDNVFIGPHVVFTNVSTPRAFVDRKEEFEPTRVKRGASIGANATIVCGHVIGEFAMVGAGSVVTKDVRRHQLVVGNPAKFVEHLCECGSHLFHSQCPRCNVRYTWDETGPVKESTK